MHICATVHMWKLEHNLWGAVLSLNHSGPGTKLRLSGLAARISSSSEPFLLVPEFGSLKAYLKIQKVASGVTGHISTSTHRASEWQAQPQNTSTVRRIHQSDF